MRSRDSSVQGRSASWRMIRGRGALPPVKIVLLLMKQMKGQRRIKDFRVSRRRAFVSRASDADRRSRRRGDAGRRSPRKSDLREAQGTALRTSSHGVDAPSQAALAARQLRRVFVVRAGRRQALIKRPFHFPNAPKMRICQCFQGFGLHSRPKTGDIPNARCLVRGPRIMV